MPCCDLQAAPGSLEEIQVSGSSGHINRPRQLGKFFFKFATKRWTKNGHFSKPANVFFFFFVNIQHVSFQAHPPPPPLNLTSQH